MKKKEILTTTTIFTKIDIRVFDITEYKSEVEITKKQNNGINTEKKLIKDTLKFLSYPLACPLKRVKSQQSGNNFKNL